MNDIVFKKQNGGMGRTAASEDPISGLVMSMKDKLASGDLAKFDTVGSLYIAKLHYYEQLSSDFGMVFSEPGDSSPGKAQAKNAVSYHVREFFRQSPTGILYLAVKPDDEVTGEEIKRLQSYSEGAIRQVGIFTSGFGKIADYQTAATELEAEHRPLSIVVTSYGQTKLTLEDLKTVAYSTAGRCNVSLLVGCDLDPSLVNFLGDGVFNTYGCIGNLLGCLSAASVNESIAWVGKFPLGLTLPGLITGDLINEISAGDLDILDGGRYIFVRTHVGTAGCFFNDSHTLDAVTSDYAYIENVRTMDKATRGIRSNLLPYLNAPLYVDASTGKLRADTVATLETVAGRALEDMEKAGELSGYRVEIDPEQNVLATSELEAVIRNVPVGVMRRIKVKIGFATKI
jgi:hypothetical protein